MIQKYTRLLSKALNTLNNKPRIEQIRWILSDVVRGGFSFHRWGALPPMSIDEALSWPEPQNTFARTDLISRVQAFPYWYHRIYLGQDVYTTEGPLFHENVWRWLRPAIPADLRGSSILDIGANAGFFSIQAKLRNAGRVVAVEPDERYLEQAALCCQVWGIEIDYLPIEADQIAMIEDKFDIALFTGILYHLKHPLSILEHLGRLCQDAIVVETVVIPPDPRNHISVRLGPYGKTKITGCRSGFMKFIETTELEDDPTNWWVPDVECLMGMLRTAGFRYFSPVRYVTEDRVLVIASKKETSVLMYSAL